jgi:hypothetical protein
MLRNFEMAKEDETAQEKWKMARKLKRQVRKNITHFFQMLPIFINIIIK